MVMTKILMLSKGNSNLWNRFCYYFIKMAIMKTLTALILSLFFYSCSTLYSTTDYDRSADFDAYKTYSFYGPSIDKLKLNDLDKRRILESIEDQMTAKGFTMMKDSPDLLVNVHASSKEVVNVNNWNNGWGWGWWPMWGGFNSTTTSRFNEGTLIIDIVDANKNILVWQGITSGIRVDNLKTKDEQLREAVSKVFKDFPPNKPRRKN